MMKKPIRALILTAALLLCAPALNFDPRAAQDKESRGR